jgi:hypothetical protein
MRNAIARIGPARSATLPGASTTTFLPGFARFLKNKVD